MKNSTLLMVGIVAAVAMLSAAVVAVPIQQASAERRSSSDGGNTDFNFEQDQKNKCSGSAWCTNTATITFG